MDNHNHSQLWTLGSRSELPEALLHGIEQRLHRPTLLASRAPTPEELRQFALESGIGDLHPTTFENKLITPSRFTLSLSALYDSNGAQVAQVMSLPGLDDMDSLIQDVAIGNPLGSEFAVLPEHDYGAEAVVGAIAHELGHQDHAVPSQDKIRDFGFRWRHFYGTVAPPKDEDIREEVYSLGKEIEADRAEITNGRAWADALDLPGDRLVASSIARRSVDSFVKRANRFGHTTAYFLENPNVSSRDPAELLAHGQALERLRARMRLAGTLHPLVQPLALKRAREIVETYPTEIKDRNLCQQILQATETGNAGFLAGSFDKKTSCPVADYMRRISLSESPFMNEGVEAYFLTYYGAKTLAQDYDFKDPRERALCEQFIRSFEYNTPGLARYITATDEARAAMDARALELADTYMHRNCQEAVTAARDEGLTNIVQLALKGDAQSAYRHHVFAQTLGRDVPAEGFETLGADQRTQPIPEQN